MQSTSKDHPQVKEQGDYNLKYLIAAALLDDRLGPAQLDEKRIQAPNAQSLLTRVDIRPDDHFSAHYPTELSARVTIRTKDQRVFVKEQNGYEGGLTNPMSWERTVEKFHWLTEAFADEMLRCRIIEAVERLDTSELSDLTELLDQVQPIAVFRRRTPVFNDRFAFGNEPSTTWQTRQAARHCLSGSLPLRKPPHWACSW